MLQGTKGHQGLRPRKAKMSRVAVVEGTVCFTYTFVMHASHSQVTVFVHVSVFST